MEPAENRTTEVWAAMSRGDADAIRRVWPRIYDELHHLAVAALRSERSGHTLQPTALVHEAYLKLAQQTPVQWRDRRHFFAVASRVIRQILVDHARARATEKRGGGANRLTLADADGASSKETIDLVGLDEAISRLAVLNERQSRVVELRFFAGLEVVDIAEVLGVSDKTVKNDWRFAKAWLRKALAEDEHS